MKKLFLTLLFLMLIFPLISAAEIQFQGNSDVFDQGETLIAVVSGNFIDQVTRNNVFFYKDHVRTPVSFDVVKSNVNNDFYIYGILLDKTSGNYSLRIENVRYMQGTEVLDDDLRTNFTITENTTDFYVNPGFVSTSGDFSIELQNLQFNKITIDINVPSGLSLQGPSSFDVSSGEIKKIDFLLDEETFPNNVMETISVSSDNIEYDVPVFITGSESSTPGQQQEDLDMMFQPDTVIVTLATGSNAKRIIYLQNTGKEDIEDIDFFVSSLLEPYITIDPDEINNLKANSSEKIEIEIVSDLEEAVLEGTITAVADNVSTSFTLILDFVEDFVPENPGQQPGDEIIVTTCSQLSGTICSENKQCSGESVDAKDGVCCLAQCQDVEESSGGLGKIIGWAIIVAVVLLLLWFFKSRYRGVKKKLPFGLKN